MRSVYIFLFLIAYLLPAQDSVPIAVISPAKPDIQWLKNETLISIEQLLTKQNWNILEQFKSEKLLRYEFGSFDATEKALIQRLEMKQFVLPDTFKRSPMAFFGLGTNLANTRCKSVAVVNVLSGPPKKEDDPLYIAITCKKGNGPIGEIIEETFYRLIPGTASIFVIGVIKKNMSFSDSEINEWRVKLRAVSVSPGPQTPDPRPEAEKPVIPQ